MIKESELSVVRRAFAKHILSLADVSNPVLETAFSEVRREKYLGEGPWPLFRSGGYVQSPSADPIHLYTDDLVGIMPDRRINNGQPHIHAFLIHNANPKDGEHIVHIGAGVGYYTAVLSQLVGSSGKVTAIEIDPELAGRARSNLKDLPNVQVVHGDGARVGFSEADVIYVNAGVTRPADTWLENLADGGRMILPLTTDEGLNHLDPKKMKLHGGIFKIARKGTDFFADWISPIAIIPAESLRSADSEAALAAAFASGSAEAVTRLYRHTNIAEDCCWLRGSDWCLAYE